MKVWGATAAEVSETYPCDVIGFPHDDVCFRAVDIEAPPALVFRWLCQLKVAPYSYDWLDNFGRRSPSKLTPDLEQLHIGQRVMRIFRIVSYEPGRHITIASGLEAPTWLMGDCAVTYRVRAAKGGTRLVVKLLVARPRGAHGRLLGALFPFGDFIMMRKQLLTLRRYAERDARAQTSKTAGSPLV